MSQQGILSDPTSNFETLTGNTGGPVGPDGSGNINILGDGFLSVAGNPGSFTLTISDDGTVATTFTEDSGTATPLSNNINILGGTGVDTSGAGDTITIEAADAVPLLFTEDSGTATPALNNLNISGGNGIGTTGAGDTVTVAMESPFTGSFNFTAAVTANSFVTNNASTGLTISANEIEADGSNANIDIDLIPKGDGGTYTDRLKVNYGGATNAFTINGVSVDADVVACDSGGVTVIEYLANSISNTAATGPRILGARSRDAGGFTPSIVQNNDSLLDIYATGFDGTDYSTSAQIGMDVDGTPGNNDMPGRIVFYTSQNGTENLTEGMRIDSSQNIYFTQYTQNSLNYTGASGLQTELGPLTDGQLIIGATGGAPVAATLASADGSVTIANGTNSIDLSVTETSLSWNVETGTTEDLAADNGYIGNNAAGVTFTLPATASVGDTFIVTGLQASWTIAQNAGQTIYFGNQSTTTGAGGSLASTNARDVVEFICVVADTDFQVLSSIGNITVT